MTVILLQEAQAEFLEAISYYEQARAGLGQRFKGEVERTMIWIAAHPEFCRLRPGGYQRMNLRVFPYYVPYIVRGTTLWVLAVAHAHRQPEYWIQRKNSAC